MVFAEKVKRFVNDWDESRKQAGERRKRENLAFEEAYHKGRLVEARRAGMRQARGSFAKQKQGGEWNVLDSMASAAQGDMGGAVFGVAAPEIAKHSSGFGSGMFEAEGLISRPRPS